MQVVGSGPVGGGSVVQPILTSWWVELLAASSFQSFQRTRLQRALLHRSNRKTGGPSVSVVYGTTSCTGYPAQCQFMLRFSLRAPIVRAVRLLHELWILVLKSVKVGEDHKAAG